MWGGGRGGIKFIQMFRLKGIVLKSDLVFFQQNWKVYVIESVKKTYKLVRNKRNKRLIKLFCSF